MGNDKRKFTSNLPSDWRTTIFNHVNPLNIELLEALAVLELTGCRPHELEKGIDIEYVERDDDRDPYLVFYIEGSKVGSIIDQTGKFNERGQPNREIGVAINSAPARLLANLACDQIFIHVQYHRKSISSRIGELSRLAFPRKREHVSAYCYRHQFASDLKSAGVEKKMIAQSLGHLSDYSCGKYGRRRREGGGGVSNCESPIIYAAADREVKQSPKTDRFRHFRVKNNRHKR